MAWYGTSPWAAWASCPGCAPSQLLEPPCWQGAVRSRNILGCAGTALQQLTPGVNTTDVHRKPQTLRRTSYSEEN